MLKGVSSAVAEDLDDYVACLEDAARVYELEIEELFEMSALEELDGDEMAPMVQFSSGYVRAVADHLGVREPEVMRRVRKARRKA